MTAQQKISVTIGGTVVELSAFAKKPRIIAEIETELAAARKKFPNPSLSMTALTEEVGELAKALLDESPDRVRKEATQVAVMAIRVATEGDPSHNDLRTARSLGLIAYDATDDIVITGASNDALTPPALGELWKGQGGIYAGLVRGSNNQPDHHLIVAPPGSIGHLNNVQIGTRGTDVVGATHRTDGMANTKAFASEGSELCQQMLDMHIDGHRDWYLGADGEFHFAYCNVPELFDKQGWYITSTQRGARYVRIQDFEYGLSYGVSKDYSGRAVAFRRIQLSNSVPQ